MVANDWLCQFLADILDVPVERPVVTETTALGAACLAGLEVGLYPSLEAVASGWRCARRFEPQMAPTERARLYDGWLARGAARARDRLTCPVMPIDADDLFRRSRRPGQKRVRSFRRSGPQRSRSKLAYSGPETDLVVGAPPHATISQRRIRAAGLATLVCHEAVDALSRQSIDARRIVRTVADVDQNARHQGE